MTPGIGLMDRRLKTEKDAISLATSGILKNLRSILLKQNMMMMQEIGMLHWVGTTRRLLLKWILSRLKFQILKKFSLIF